MAEETPQNINPATDPQVEDPPATAVPVAEIDTGPAPVAPVTNPEVPQPSIDIATITASQPDAAFQRAQQAKEERWQTAATANPDGIRNDGSVSVDLGDGQREIINRDGSFSIAGPAGEYRYNADGQLESYTTPNFGGLSRTYTTDGVVVETFSAGPLRTESISYNGTLISTNTTTQVGDVTLQSTQVGDGPPVNSASTVINGAQVVVTDIVPQSAIDTGPAEVAGDPEVDEFVAQQEAADFVPVADIDTGPPPVTQDEEIISFEEAQAQNEFVPASAIDTAATEVNPADNPEVPQPVDDLPDAFVYDTADTIELADDPIILAQADATATDVALVDITQTPDIVGEDDPAIPQDVAPPEGGFYGEPTPVGGNFTAVYDPETGTYNVVDLDTGETVDTGLSQQDATLVAQDLSLGDPQFPNDTEDLAAAAESDLIREPTDVDVAEAAFVETDTGFFELQEEAAPQPDEFGFVEADDGFFVQQDEIEAQIDQTQFEGETGAEEFVPLSEIETEPEPVDSPYEDEDPNTLTQFTADGPELVDPTQAQADAAREQAALDTARAQQSVREQRGNSVDSADWRVRLRLAPRASYLYRADEAGILTPLQVSDGIIFPYTPTVSTVYKANYDSKALTHSNYRGLFYQSSYVEDINITGVFTAQDTVEAEYLLAVIHFFRSATKMFYGQDPQRGAPPPLVFLSAYGAYQYVDAPCVISSFNYNLPADVDYIRARAPNQDGTNLLKRRDRQSLPTNAFDAALQRLKNARSGGLPKGAQINKPPPPSLGLSSPTYVPTRMEITIVLHPVQTRKQVSQQFSVKEYAPGRLQNRGFW